MKVTVQRAFRICLEDGNFTTIWAEDEAEALRIYEQGINDMPARGPAKPKKKAAGGKKK